MRQTLLNQIAAQILTMPSPPIVRVAVDGVDGAGKTTFADELAQILASSQRQIIRASVDGFHNPRHVRYARGRHSPAGFFDDSYNYVNFKAMLLEPLSSGGNRRYRTAAFDHHNDAPVDQPEQMASDNAILIVDGIFLHRPELRESWDFSIFLHVDFEVSIPRGAQRDHGDPDPTSSANQRYVLGQQLYLRECQPQRHATLVIDNNDLTRPFVS